MLNNDLMIEIDKLIKVVQEFWGGNVSKIKFEVIEDSPYDEFTLSMLLYNRYQIMMEYERSTLGISVKTKDRFVILSKFANKPIYRGLKSYVFENLLHNFKVLDETLRSIEYKGTGEKDRLTTGLLS